MNCPLYYQLSNRSIISICVLASLTKWFQLAYASNFITCTLTFLNFIQLNSKKIHFQKDYVISLSLEENMVVLTKDYHILRIILNEIIYFDWHITCKVKKWKKSFCNWANTFYPFIHLLDSMYQTIFNE